MFINGYDTAMFRTSIHTRFKYIITKKISNAKANNILQKSQINSESNLYKKKIDEKNVYCKQAKVNIWKKSYKWLMKMLVLLKRSASKKFYFLNTKPT